MDYLKTIIDFLACNWTSIIVVIALIIAVSVTLKNFFSLAADEQQEKIKKWLLYAVTVAETELGGGTGQLKLATVYDMFVRVFPVIKNFVSVETFSVWVDEVLEEMRHMLETNAQINSLVTGSDETLTEESVG